MNGKLSLPLVSLTGVLSITASTTLANTSAFLEPRWSITWLMRAAHHHNGKCAIAAFATSSNGLFRCEEGERGEEGEKDSMKKTEEEDTWDMTSSNFDFHWVWARNYTAKLQKCTITLKLWLGSSAIIPGKCTRLTGALPGWEIEVDSIINERWGVLKSLTGVVDCG